MRAFIFALTFVATATAVAHADDSSSYPVHRADYVLRGKTTAAVVHMDIHKPQLRPELQHGLLG